MGNFEVIVSSLLFFLKKFLRIFLDIFTQNVLEISLGGCFFLLFFVKTKAVVLFFLDGVRSYFCYLF